MPRTQQERKATTRSSLLAAAATLFAEHGIDAVSVDAVAEAAGRTSGAVYAHFGSKQGLLLAVLDDQKRSVRSVLSAAVSKTGSPVGQLAAVWENVGEPRPEAATWSLLEHELWLRAARDPLVAEALRSRDVEGRRRSADEIARWAPAVGARPVGSPEESAVLLKALLTGLEMQRRLDPGSVPSGLAVRGLAALVGIQAAPAGPATIDRHDDRHDDRTEERHRSTTKEGLRP